MNAGNSFFVCHIINNVVANSSGLFFRLFQIKPKVNILEFQMTSAKLDMVIMAHTCAGYSLIGPLARLFAFCLCSQLSFLCSCQSYDTCCCKERSLSVFPTFWDRIKEQTLLHKAPLSYLIYFLTNGKTTLSTQQKKKNIFLKTWNTNDNSIIRKNSITFSKIPLCPLHYRLWTSHYWGAKLYLIFFFSFAYWQKKIYLKCRCKLPFFLLF